MSDRSTDRPSAPRIDVRIDELVLSGFDPSDRGAIAEGLRAELARLFGEQDPMANVPPGQVEHLDAGAVHVLAGERPPAIGASVAGAVLRRLAR